MLKFSSRSTQKVAFTILWAAGIITLLVLLLIIGYIIVRGLPGFSWDFLITPPAGGLAGEGGISSTIVTTLYLVGLTLLILVPVGIGAAIYLVEYAPDNRLTRFIRYGVQTLAGVPSILFGLFGFALFVTALHFRFSILSGALTLACLLLPVLITATEEALKAVPRSYRAGAMALGATKWQAVTHVILPAALPGIATGVILCAGRALGETACLYVTMGGSAAMPESLLSGGRSLALHVFYLATETNAMDKAMATAAVLIVIIVGLNGLTNFISRRFQKRICGGV
ncbi:MAG: phosphate ABC transporter permease PstA [Dehalococcoides mccartyi]|jgi:phosphate ABC transporter, permease protein PstA|uniref:Phosphate transport system permease protein PstA n=3 Tax=root TaxID=1 RepID=A0A0V8M3V0_9CHLR|nr:MULTISPECIES: phosphate ABC transporter permease PstA [Dehalococcoides]AAW40523.1 phosphate ABC transporter, permease protein [Dehalococcoides mccartyi 195]AII58913.1 phosphate ABC transporter permease [Dehalococcoides mccartyi CG4]AQU02630.1 phosphate ABC transporter, permease protein PstA [Dehalococcoides mccartyi]AQU03965.1 phosphate ABC transporter, permease protein PstA [Dehalococcoides mccartyi]KSV18440.1 phosphate ABC transporter permease [Dehalococcoides mccartyi]